MRGIYVWFVADDKPVTNYPDPHADDDQGLTEGELQRWAYISYFAICQPGVEDETLPLRRSSRNPCPKFQETTTAR